MSQNKRALISVYDKAGVFEFARELIALGFEIVSTGGTAKLLKEKGLAITEVEQVTDHPEMLDGRVKTLHPSIHAAILARRDLPEHMRQLKKQGIVPIDLVVVNLYPFEATIAKPGVTEEEAFENIDVGGPSLLRGAAKNCGSRRKGERRGSAPAANWRAVSIEPRMRPPPIDEEVRGPRPRPPDRTIPLRRRKSSSVHRWPRRATPRARYPGSPWRTCPR